MRKNSFSFLKNTWRRIYTFFSNWLSDDIYILDEHGFISNELKEEINRSFKGVVISVSENKTPVAIIIENKIFKVLLRSIVNKKMKRKV